MKEGICLNKKCRLFNQPQQILKGMFKCQNVLCGKPLQSTTEINLPKQVMETNDWGYLDKLKVKRVTKTLDVSGGGTASFEWMSCRKGESKYTVLLAHGRQQPDAWIKVPGRSYYFAFMVPWGRSLFREQFVQNADVYYNYIADYLKFFSCSFDIFKANWCIPQQYLGPHNCFELNNINLIKALDDILNSCNVVIFTELNLVKPEKVQLGHAVDPEEYQLIYDDMKIPLYDLLIRNELVENNHHILFMTCRSPWPAPKLAVEYAGPGDIHTWYKEDHVLINLKVPKYE